MTTYEGIVQHVYEGRNHPQRLEVHLLTERFGQPFVIDDAYLWVNDDHRKQLAGSLLLAAQHTGARVRIVGQRARMFGFRVDWAEQVEAV